MANTQTTYTPTEYEAAHPRARAFADAIRYVTVMCRPNRYPRPETIKAASGEKVVMVGWSNMSRSKAVARYAVVAA